ncbi:MAG: PTS sugar transporter subunit IIA [Spirochaetales bacterium]|nr:PTS sugar transporter subunit IIA [Spirochaetales bacterium]
MMTLSDVAEALKVSEKTISRMLQDGAIPGFKVANQWRFYREDFYRWIDAKRGEWGNRARAGLASMLSSEMDAVPLSRLTEERFIVTGIPRVPSESIFRILTDPLEQAGILSDSDLLVRGLAAREMMMSTGVGGGVAIPHLRNPSKIPVSSPLMVIGLSLEGVDWNSIDGQPVHVFMLPLAGSEVPHLRMLAAIRSFLAADSVVEGLKKAKTPQEVMRTILEVELRTGNLADQEK